MMSHLLRKVARTGDYFRSKLENSKSLIVNGLWKFNNENESSTNHLHLTTNYSLFFFFIKRSHA